MKRVVNATAILMAQLSCALCVGAVRHEDPPAGGVDGSFSASTYAISGWKCSDGGNRGGIGLRRNLLYVQSGRGR